MKNSLKYIGLVGIIFLLILLTQGEFMTIPLTIDVGQIVGGIGALFEGSYCIFTSELKIEELPNDRVIFGRLVINKSSDIKNLRNITYKLYSITYKGDDLKELFSTKIDVIKSLGDSFEFSSPIFAMSPDKQWVLLQDVHYDDKAREYEKMYYIVRSDGTELQLLLPEFKDKKHPSTYLDLKWSLDNTAYFNVIDKWFSYNPEGKKINGPYNANDINDIKFVHPFGGTTINYSDTYGKNIRWNEAILSPKKDLILYFIVRNDIIYNPWSDSGSFLYLTVAKPDGSKEKRLHKLKLSYDVMEWSRDGDFIILGSKTIIYGALERNYPSLFTPMPKEDFTYNPRFIGYEIFSVKECKSSHPIIVEFVF